MRKSSNVHVCASFGFGTNGACGGMRARIRGKGVTDV